MGRKNHNKNTHKRCAKRPSRTFKRHADANRPFLTYGKADVGDCVYAINHKHTTPKMRPFFLWSLYVDFNASSNGAGIAAIDALNITSQYKARIDNLIFPDNIFLGQSGGAIVCNSSDVLLNSSSLIGRLVYGAGQSDRLLPDLVIRRTCALLHNAHLNDSVSSSLNMHGFSRRGIVFREITHDKLADQNASPLDIADADIEQLGFSIPGFLDQNDIDRIARIAENFVQHCKNKHLPIFWPETGIWPNWPEEFLAFEDPDHKPRYFEYSWNRPHAEPENPSL